MLRKLGMLYLRMAFIKMMFVDGDKHVYDIKEKKAKKEGDDMAEETSSADAGAYGAILGSWSYVFEVPGQEQTGKMIIKMENGMLTGVLTSDNGGCSPPIGAGGGIALKFNFQCAPTLAVGV